MAAPAPHHGRRMAVHRRGSGPDLVLFHGGMGSWRHWIRSYKEVRDDEQRFREVCRHNLLVNMLSDPASVTEEAVDIHADNVRRARFDSRKVSGGGTLLPDLAALRCRIRLLWGERDDSAFRPARLLIGEIREADEGAA